MPRFAANLTWLFTELPFLDRFDAAAEAGFHAVEFLFPYEQHHERLGHVQIADPPGRHEPGRGELDFPPLFELLDRLGYAGWIGCEYRPSQDSWSSLAWAEAYGISSRGPAARAS